MSEPNPIDRLREALDLIAGVSRVPGDGYTEGQSVEDRQRGVYLARAALSQLETEREADRGRIAELETALAVARHVFAFLPEPSAALRAPETAPVDGELAETLEPTEVLRLSFGAYLEAMPGGAV